MSPNAVKVNGARPQAAELSVQVVLLDGALGGDYRRRDRVDRAGGRGVPDAERRRQVADLGAHLMAQVERRLADPDKRPGGRARGLPGHRDLRGRVGTEGNVLAERRQVASWRPVTLGDK